MGLRFELRAFHLQSRHSTDPFCAGDLKNFFIILATQEAEIRRIVVQSQPWKIEQETLS
jgi:hypothetical protein